MSRLKWLLWLLPLLVGWQKAQASVTVNFPTPSDTYSYYYGYPYMALAGDKVTGTRSAAPLPSVNTLTVNMTVYFSSGDYNYCSNNLLFYMDGQQVGYVTLQAAPAYYFGTYTVYGSVAVPATNSTNHTISVALQYNSYNYVCGYTYYVIDDAVSTITMDLVGADADGDGHYSKAYYGDDCNDADASIYTGANEICDARDNNCNGVVDEGVMTTYYQDADGDGYGSSATTQACSKPAGYSTVAGDCDDTRAGVNPAAREVCNGIDDNCNGAIDEAVKNTYYVDADGDGYGGTATTTACSTPSGYTTAGGDCDDTKASVHPNATEQCNSIDDDCDGLIDEGVLVTWYKDTDADGYGQTGATTTACSKPSGYSSIGGDCNDADATSYPGAAEKCDGKDNNCDGQIDEGVMLTWYKDADGDGYGTTSTTTACTRPTGYASISGDCNDADATVYPSAAEKCDGKDNNCDGQIDEGVKLTWYKDADSDGYGVSSSSTQACTKPSGYATVGGDCDDADAATYPGAAEKCDSKDNNCDGQIDEGVKLTYYKDTDGDGYGQSGSTSAACAKPSGYAPVGGDCDDTDASSYPGAVEKCDGKDNNCDGKTDEGVQATWYKDGDGDGYGQSGATTAACTKPTGYAPVGGDCDDTKSSVNPGAKEACNGIDDNCDGKIDEGVQNTYYKDADGDGYGTSSTTLACTVPAGYATVNGDCNDGDPKVYPGATEVCDGKDNNCDGQIDEGGLTTWYKDGDNDGYGLGTVAKLACTQPTGYSSQPGDCDDTNAAVHPNATEVCNNVDDDCDGAVDEGARTTWYADDDKDGYGDPARPADACTAPTGYVADHTDCNDADPKTYPGAPETCDGRDNNCNGQIDEGVQATWYQDADADGYGNAAVTRLGCERPVGYAASSTDCDDTNAAVHPGASESCNGKDDNCDGQVDEGVKTTFYLDSDADGYGDARTTTAACSRPTGYVSDPGAADRFDCDDTNAAIHPGATEVCNDIDDDCDGQIDDQVQTTFYQDSDADGYGNPTATLAACLPPAGYVADQTDCDDTSAAIHPSATEVCGDGIDQDCNNYDLGCDVTDQDGDGYSPSTGDCDDADPASYPDALETCDGKDNNCNGVIDDVDLDLDGYVDVACAGTDCDDTDPTLHPDAEEVCDGVDNDCDGQIDNRDLDGDGYIDAACTAGGPNALDCDDANEQIHPGAAEICDGLDNDCDGMTDNLDADGDGYASLACGGTDCNDADANTYPGAPELEDGADNDCDGLSDEATDAYDDDGDGYTENTGDCNDADGSIHPGAPELPDDNVDNDCDGQVDESDVSPTPSGDDDATAGDDDATGGDDDATAGDDDATGGDDDATAGDDDSATTPPDGGATSTPTGGDESPSPTDVPTGDAGGCQCDTATAPAPSAGSALLVIGLAATFYRRRTRRP